MNILALDLGTNLGWALSCPVRGISAGTLVLATDKNLRYAKKLRMDRRLDIRIQAFAVWLETQPADFCVFEDVRFASSQAQAHLWGSLRGVVWSWAARRGIDIDSLDTGKLKVWATGHGNATKDMMEWEALNRWPEYASGRDLDDNGIDALCLLMWAREKIK